MTRSSTGLRRSRPLVFLFGPTASGKTAFVESLAGKGWQVVNADSVQVYRRLDIGSAKPSPELMRKIPHHLVDILEPWEQFTVGDFVRLADEACLKIWEEGDVPLVTGGTAYYFKHFLYGLSGAPTADLSIRAALQEELAEKGSQRLHDELSAVDPGAAAKINPNDSYRVTRALEVYRQTGRPLSSFRVPDHPRDGLDPLIINLSRGRDDLRRRIDMRVDQMFSEGLVDEVKSLLREGGSRDWPGLSGIGYSEFLEAREIGCATPSDIRAKIKKDTWQYARRQMTFFKSFAGAVDADPDDSEGLSALLGNYLNQKLVVRS